MTRHSLSFGTCLFLEHNVSVQCFQAMLCTVFPGSVVYNVKCSVVYSNVYSVSRQCCVQCVQVILCTMFQGNVVYNVSMRCCARCLKVMLFTMCQGNVV